MIKTHPEAESEPAPVLPPTPTSFPSPFLIVMSVISCFLATGAFVASLTQLATYYPYFLVPSGIGFFLTVPYHVFLYILAHKHRQAEKGPQFSGTFIPSDCLLWSFILITLWTVIFFINILFCIGTGGPFGVVMATILSGFEWIVLLLIALKSVREVWLNEKVDPSDAEHQAVAGGASGEAPTNPHAPKTRPRPSFLVSYVLCSLTLLFSISISTLCLVNVIAFFITAPHHIALFVGSIRPHSPNTILYRRSNVPFAFVLAGLWCCVFVLDIVGNGALFQKIISGIFGGLECILIAYLAIRSVLDSFAEGKIKL